MGGTIISTTGGDTTPTKGRKTPRKHEDIDGQNGAERGAARRGRGPAEAPRGLLACETLARPRSSARVFRDLAAEADGGTHDGD